MRPSIPSSSPMGGNEISGLGEKLYVTLCLATLCQGWTNRIAKALSFSDASPFFATFDWSFPLPCFSSLIACVQTLQDFISNDTFRGHSLIACAKCRYVLESLERADILLPLPPSLLNTPFSFLPNLVNTASLSESLCPGDSDPSRLILEKTLGVGSGLLDVLQECLDLYLLSCSPLKFSVLDSECCDISWIFELLLEHPSKLRRAFTSFSLSCWVFS
ncbi:hypothetical protein Tco_0397115 [Tanacetum coccineum]